MTTQMTFDFHGSQLRTATLNGDPAIVLTDVAKILGYRDATTAGRILREHHKGYAEVRTPGGTQQMLVVTERGFNRLVMRSNASNAEAVQDWVTDDVLPQIARTGGYGAPAQLTGPELMAAALIEAQATLTAKDREIRTLAPKASRYDAFLGADGDYPLRDAAQILSREHGIKIGQNNLARWMRDNSWIDRKGIPYQHRIDAGHLRAKPQTRVHQRTGERVACDPQVRVTPRGLDLLAERLAGPKLVEVAQ